MREFKKKKTVMTKHESTSPSQIYKENYSRESGESGESKHKSRLTYNQGEINRKVNDEVIYLNNKPNHINIRKRHRVRKIKVNKHNDMYGEAKQSKNRTYIRSVPRFLSRK
jgi:hypothetical protein